MYSVDICWVVLKLTISPISICYYMITTIFCIGSKIEFHSNTAYIYCEYTAHLSFLYSFIRILLLRGCLLLLEKLQSTPLVTKVFLWEIRRNIACCLIHVLILSIIQEQIPHRFCTVSLGIYCTVYVLK